MSFLKNKPLQEFFLTTTQSHSWRIALLLSSLTAVVIVAPSIFLGNVAGHDFQSHVASWMEIASQWRQGIIFPRWAEWSNWGMGEPRFIFYPPLSWVFAAGLGSVLPWRVVPGALIFLSVVTSGMTMWAVARLWLGETKAYAAAVLFAANPYHLLVIFYRSDFAELIASALFPLIFLGAYRLIHSEWRRLPTFAFVFGAVWLLNAPAGVVTTYSVGFLLLAGCLYRFSIRPLINGTVALAGGFGVAAFYLFPAAWERRWVQIGTAFEGRFVAERNLLFAQIYDPNRPEIQLFNWKISGVAVGVIVVTAVAVFLARRQIAAHRELWWLLLTLGCVSSFLMLPPSAFLWRHMPELRFLQFPWRWLMPLDFVFAFFTGAAIVRIRAIWWFVIVLALMPAAAAILKEAHWENRIVPYVAGQIQTGQGYRGILGFTPLDAHVSEQYQEHPLFTASLIEGDAPVVPQVKIEKWTAEQRIFAAGSPKAFRLMIRLLNYPAWQVQVDDHASVTASDPATGEMTVPLDAGWHRLQIIFRRTWDRTAGAVISFISLLILVVTALPGFAKSRGRVAGRSAASP